MESLFRLLKSIFIFCCFLIGFAGVFGIQRTIGDVRRIYNKSCLLITTLIYIVLDIVLLWSIKDTTKELIYIRASVFAILVLLQGFDFMKYYFFNKSPLTKLNSEPDSGRIGFNYENSSNVIPISQRSQKQEKKKEGENKAPKKTRNTEQLVSEVNHNKSEAKNNFEVSGVDKVLEVLREHPEGLTIKEISEESGIKDEDIVELLLNDPDTSNSITSSKNKYYAS